MSRDQDHTAVLPRRRWLYGIHRLQGHGHRGDYVRRKQHGHYIFRRVAECNFERLIHSHDFRWSSRVHAEG